MIFWKVEVAQRKGNILGNFLFEQLFYSFTKVSNFRICFFVRLKSGLMFFGFFQRIGHFLLMFWSHCTQGR